MNASGNRQYTSATINKLISNSGAGGGSVGGGGDPFSLFGDDDDDPTTSADPEFYANVGADEDSRHGPPHLAEDIYDFSNMKPSLRLESSSNNPTDDEEEGEHIEHFINLRLI